MTPWQPPRFASDVLPHLTAPFAGIVKILILSSNRLYVKRVGSFPQSGLPIAKDLVL